MHRRFSLFGLELKNGCFCDLKIFLEKNNFFILN